MVLVVVVRRWKDRTYGTGWDAVVVILGGDGGDEGHSGEGD